MNCPARDLHRDARRERQLVGAHAGGVEHLADRGCRRRSRTRRAGLRSSEIVTTVWCVPGGAIARNPVTHRSSVTCDALAAGTCPRSPAAPTSRARSARSPARRAAIRGSAASARAEPSPSPPHPANATSDHARKHRRGFRHGAQYTCGAPRHSPPGDGGSRYARGRGGAAQRHRVRDRRRALRARAAVGARGRDASASSPACRPRRRRSAASATCTARSCRCSTSARCSASRPDRPRARATARSCSRPTAWCARCASIRSITSRRCTRPAARSSTPAGRPLTLLDPAAAGPARARQLVERAVARCRDARRVEPHVSDERARLRSRRAGDAAPAVPRRGAGRARGGDRARARRRLGAAVAPRRSPR